MELKTDLYSDPLAAIAGSLIESEAKLQVMMPAHVKTVFNLQDAIAASNVLISEYIPEPPKCMAVRSGNHNATIGTLGNFSLLIGKAKGKKSFLIQLLLNAAINQGDSNAFIESTLPEGKRTVLVIDTEQGRYRSQKILKRAERQAAGHNGLLKVHDLRGYTTDERLQMTEELIYNTPDLGLVFIDGVRDLVSSINDELIATDICSMLLKWTAERQIHICLVLHQNKNDSNARGHLGSELVNKAETVLSATKSLDDESMSIVQAEACRDREFLPFAFCIDDEGLPLIVPGYVHEEAKTRPGAWKPDDISIEVHRAVLGKVWPSYSSPFLKYGQFMALMITEFASFGISISKSRSSMLKVFYVSMGLLEIHGSQPATKYKYIKKEVEAKPKQESQKDENILFLD